MVLNRGQRTNRLTARHGVGSQFMCALSKRRPVGVALHDRCHDLREPHARLLDRRGDRLQRHAVAKLRRRIGYAMREPFFSGGFMSLSDPVRVIISSLGPCSECQMTPNRRHVRFSLPAALDGLQQTRREAPEPS